MTKVEFYVRGLLFRVVLEAGDENAKAQAVASVTQTLAGWPLKRLRKFHATLSSASESERTKMRSLNAIQQAAEKAIRESR
jgi:hypothetical protein